MIKRIMLLLAAVIYISAPASPVFAESPIGAIKSTVDSVLDTLREYPAKTEARSDKIRRLLRERFNFIEMSKRSLARHWKQMSKEQRAEFVDLFSELLEESYIGKIESYTDEKVTYDKEKIRGKGKYAIVNTTIVTKDVDIPIDYKVIFRNGKWSIYDVIIEGVSFISTYRSQYGRIIRKDSFSGLIKSMKKKLGEIKGPNRGKKNDDMAQTIMRVYMACKMTGNFHARLDSLPAYHFN